MMALNLGDNPGGCDALAQVYGALAFVDGVCVPVSGRVIKIGDSEHSVMEGFEITNYNFHANGNKPSVPTQNNLPGAGASGRGGALITA
jgi:hypothetical protein